MFITIRISLRYRIRWSIYSRNPQCFSRRLCGMETIILVGLLLHFQPFVNFAVALTVIDTLTCPSSVNYAGRLTTPRNLRSFYIHGPMFQTTSIVYFFSPLQPVPYTQINQPCFVLVQKEKNPGRQLVHAAKFLRWRMIFWGSSEWN